MHLQHHDPARPGIDATSRDGHGRVKGGRRAAEQVQRLDGAEGPVQLDLRGPVFVNDEDLWPSVQGRTHVPFSVLTSPSSCFLVTEISPVIAPSD